MKKDILLVIIGVVIGWIIMSAVNHPGKFQVIDIIHPRLQQHQTCLLNTHTGQIQQLVYGLTGNIYWGPPEARNETEYNKLYPLTK